MTRDEMRDWRVQDVAKDIVETHAQATPRDWGSPDRAGEVRALRYESHRDKIERPHDGQIRAFEVLPTYTLTLYLEQRQ